MLLDLKMSEGRLVKLDCGESVDAARAYEDY